MHRSIVAASTVLLLVATLAGAASAQDPASTQDPVGPSPSGTADPTPVVSATPAPPADPPVAAASPFVFAEPVWQTVDPGRGPAAREDHTWTVDGEGRYAYLFGGRDGAREFGDLWRYDLAQDRWKKLSPRGQRPQPRFGHSAAWVEGRGVVVFAGQRGSDFFADLWAYDPGAGRWSKLPAAGAAPKRRYGSCMIVGADGRLWVSHGFTSAGRFDDTRAYNLATERWASIAPDDRRPGERCLHDCFSSATGELVLYGGQDDGAFALGDLWLMGQERTWSRLDDPRPQARRLYAVTEAGPDAFIFGGASEDNVALADLWRVDRESLEFERVNADGGPVARSAGTLITDHERGRLLLFGGQAAVAKADVWELVDASIASDGPTLEPSPSPAS